MRRVIVVLAILLARPVLASAQQPFHLPGPQPSMRWSAEHPQPTQLETAAMSRSADPGTKGLVIGFVLGAVLGGVAGHRMCLREAPQGERCTGGIILGAGVGGLLGGLIGYGIGREDD